MISVRRLLSLLVPDASWGTLRKAALLALWGALVAGLYGILHDQVTYTISPEYFTRMKFDQFRAADFGFPNRVFVAEIGFLATWWVGLIACWFLARIAIPKFARPERQVFRAVAAIMVVAFLAGALGFFLGPVICAGRPEWASALDSMGVVNVRAFYQVAGIHLGSYSGAVVGWIAMMVAFLRRSSNQPFLNQE